MTKLWREEWNSKTPTKAVIHDVKAHLDSYMAVMSCRSMAGRFPDTTLKISSRHPPNDYFDAVGMFVVSEALKSILDCFHVNCEFFPLRIIYRNKEYTERRFYFCNILDCIECFDLINGEYIFETKPKFVDHVYRIKKLVIDENKIVGRHLFRIAKGGEGLICVSDQLVTAISRSGLTGMHFNALDDWALA